MNSVAKTANPIGITIIAGPGVKISIIPNARIVAPIAKIINLLVCFMM